MVSMVLDGIDGVDGVDGLVGETGETGARGATGVSGRSAPSSGMMGGLSYELPEFVEVEYQTRDHNSELVRIINESLFKGMI